MSHTCKELTLNGLDYKDENGEDKNIPRCKEWEQGKYEYTDEELEKKEAIFTAMCLRWGDKFDKNFLEIMLDFYLKHPDKFKESAGTDWKYDIDLEECNKENANLNI